MEQSSLSIRRTQAPIGIPKSTFYDWYSRYQEGGIEAPEDGKPRPQRNKIPDKIRTAIVSLALEEPDLSPRELAVNFTDTNGNQLHLMVPQRFFTHGQRSTGDRHVYTQRTRFIPNSVSDHFESRSWPTPKSVSKANGRTREPVDVRAKMRRMWANESL